MRPLFAVLVIAVLALVAWAVYAVLPEGGQAGEGMKLAEDVDAPTTDLSSGPASESTTGQSRERIQSDQVIDYHLVDAETGEGLPGAGIYKVKTGDLIVRCDDEGVARSTEPDPGQLYFYAEGYLLGFFLADRRQLTKMRAQAGEGAVHVPLHRDLFCYPLELRYLLPSGDIAEDIRCEITLRDAVKRVGQVNLETKRRGPELGRAWKNFKAAPTHSARLVIGTLLVEPIKKTRLSVKRILLTATGTYVFRVSAGEGFFAEEELWVDRNTKVLEIPLTQGGSFSGRVVDRETGDPIDGALVLFRNPSQSIMVGGGKSDADGQFTVHAAGGSSQELRISHPEYIGVARKDVFPGAELEISLKARPLWNLIGTLTTVGSGAAIAGGKVGVDGMKTVTGEDGSFLIEGIPMKDTAGVFVEAEGFRGSAFRIKPRDEPMEFSLIPKNPEDRVIAGITAVISGRVLYADGEPAVGMDLRLSVDGNALPGRNVYPLSELRRAPAPELYKFNAAGIFVTPGYARTNTKGEFMFESGIPGLAKIITTNLHSTSATLQIQLGQKYPNITLTTNR